MFSSTGLLVTTDLNSTMGNPQTSISTWGPDGYSNRRRIFWDPNASAMEAAWSPDGKQIAFSYGAFFAPRNTRPATIRIMNPDGSNLRTLTEGPVNYGFPTYSPDGKFLVFRAWGKDANGVEQRGLRLMDLADKSIKVLSREWDNFPYYSPDGKLILFARQQREDRDFELYTMKPDGSDVKRLLASPGTDGHATWSADGKQIYFMAARTGFKDEREMYDNSPQSYAQIFVMNADGTNIRQLTESRWEDSLPAFVPTTGKRR
jgi:Tol biopolymer transport system component